MAVTKLELLRTLERFWIIVDSLAVTTEDVDNNIVIVGTVTSATEPTQKNVVWVKPTD